MQTVKMGVQYSLWGGSVVNLGTERHRKAYFDDIDAFRLPGCAGTAAAPPRRCLASHRCVRDSALRAHAFAFAR